MTSVVVVYHNVDQHASFGLNVQVSEDRLARLSKSHELVKVYQCVVTLGTCRESDVLVAEYAWHEMNRHDCERTGEVARGYDEAGLRWLSMGDVLRIGERYFSCERIGWQECDEDDLNLHDGFASCGHPANEDGECTCSSWPEKAQDAVGRR